MSNSNVRFPKRYDFAFILVVLVIVVFMMLYVSGIILPPQNREYWAGFQKTIRNPLDKGENMTMIINLKSHTFGAQDDVTAFITLQASFNKHIVGKTLPESNYVVHFNGTSCSTPIDDQRYRTLQFCKIPLVPTWYVGKYVGEQGFVEYQGTGNLVYSQGGTFDVLLTPPMLNVETISSVGSEFIHISSLEATNSYYQSKDTFLTARMAVFIAVIAAMIAGFNVYRIIRENRMKKSLLLQQSQHDTNYSNYHENNPDSPTNIPNLKFKKDNHEDRPDE